MANVTAYKQRNRQDRRAVLDSDLSHGMMSSNGVIQEGYLKSLVNCSYEKETSAITPRPGLRLSNVIFPNNAPDDVDFLNDDIVLKDVKQCVEDGVTYTQIIISKLDEEHPDRGLIWVLTSSTGTDQTPVEFSDEYTGAVSFSNFVCPDDAHVCYFYSASSPSIHNIFLTDDQYKRIEFPVGTFAYGNSYYFFGEDGESNKGLFRTVFDKTQTPPLYVFEAVEPKVLTVSEAVTYGYNMLRGGDTYSFENQHSAPTMQFEGILPYDPVSGALLMTPKKNQAIDLICYYNVAGGKYDILWESRETTASDWTLQKKETVTFDNNTVLQLQNFHPQDKDLMFRVSAYPYKDINGNDTTMASDTVEKAMVVGFDFTTSNYGAAKSLEQKEYDLTSATGMENWNGRCAIWGLPEDPTILFISDYNEPAYFPYPNNIVVFDEPIIYCIEFMDSLCVFTTNKLYQVTLAEDGNSWVSTVLQSHLSIDPWDKHLIQVVRNMLYFKSGNYYYMMVPKAQSTTGELTLAPITTPITSFFDNFSVNVQELLGKTYGYHGDYELLTYYNFLDYEDIHNIYAYTFDDSYAILHFDIIYNTVDRTWKVWIYESANLIFPFKQEATRNGLLASTSLVQLNGESEDTARIVQVFSWDKNIVRSCYIPQLADVYYNLDDAPSAYSSYTLYFKYDIASVDEYTLSITPNLVVQVDGHTLVLSGGEDYYLGFSKSNTIRSVLDVYNQQDEYYTFRNFQFIDTGYRDDELQAKKRYREIQIQLNNLDKKNMQFGMDYILDGAPRKIFYKYEVTQSIDEFDPEYGVVYIDSTPYMETDLDTIDLTNQWSLDQQLTPEISLWKVRVAVSGKGYAPKLRLYSRNEKRFELLSIHWISKLMHMR